MVHERTTSGAGLRPTPLLRVGEPGPEQPAAPAPEPLASSGPIPVEQVPLDPRAIARASLAADRNASLWWVSGGILVALVVSLAVGTRAGSVVLAAVVAACAVVRWTAHAPGPVALSVRAKGIDVTVLFLLALGLSLLAAVLPDGWV